LYLIVKEFAAVDLYPNVVSGHDMGYIFEELIRKFADSNATQAGDHFTPREVIALMVDILFLAEDDALSKPGTVRTIYDPAAGTGGMLKVKGPKQWMPIPGRAVAVTACDKCPKQRRVDVQAPWPPHSGT